MVQTPVTSSSKYLDSALYSKSQLEVIQLLLIAKVTFIYGELHNSAALAIFHGLSVFLKTKASLMRLLQSELEMTLAYAKTALAESTAGAKIFLVMKTNNQITFQRRMNLMMEGVALLRNHFLKIFSSLFS
jgi:hypothetical protein